MLFQIFYFCFGAFPNHRTASWHRKIYIFLKFLQNLVLLFPGKNIFLIVQNLFLSRRFSMKKKILLTKKYSPSGNSATLEYKSKIRINYFLHIENNKYSSIVIIAPPTMSIYVLVSQIFIICLCFCTHYKFLKYVYELTFHLTTSRYGNQLKQHIASR